MPDMMRDRVRQGLQLFQNVLLVSEACAAHRFPHLREDFLDPNTVARCASFLKNARMRQLALGVRHDHNSR